MIETIVSILCDGDAGACEAYIEGRSVKDARQKAEQQGWRHRHGDRDYCPEHKEQTTTILTLLTDRSTT